MEYMLVLQPSDQVNEKVLLEKQDFSHQYGTKTTPKSKPYITIATFLAKEAMEGTLNRWINNICRQQQGFELTLNNFSGFPPDTIYVRVQDPMPVFTLTQQLKKLDDFMRSSECPPMKFSYKPYLAIAQKLSMETFEKALKNYSQKEFHESFAVEELILLKRSHEFDASSLVNKYHFVSGSGNS